MMKKLLCLLIAIVMGVSITVNAIAKNDKINLKASIDTNISSISNTSDINIKAIKNKFLFDLSDVKKVKDKSRLKIDLKFGEIIDNQVACSAIGTLTLNNLKHDFSVNGRLTLVSAPNGDQIYLGGLPGYIDGSNIPDKIIDLSLQYNATTGEAFIPITVGSFGDESNPPAMFEFGQMFEGLQSALETIVSTMSQSKNSEEGLPEEKITISTMSADVTEYGLSTNTGSYNGKTVIYGSYYGTKEAVPSGTWLGKIKAQVQLNNFISAYNAALPPYDPDNPYCVYTSINHCVTDVWLNFITTGTNNRINSPLPAEFSNSIKVSYPSFLIPYGKLNYAMSYVWKSDIPLNGVSHTISGSGYNSLQTKIWNGSGISGALTTSSTAPYSETTGVSNNFTISNFINEGQSCTAKTNVSAQIFFCDVQANGYTVPRWVIVSSNQSTATLKSVK